MIKELHFNIGFLVLIAAFAAIAYLIGEIFWITLATRALILGIAAIGLNIALGYGGLISFGHAAFFGLGGYAAGILSHHAQNGVPLFEGFLNLPGTQSMLIIWLVAIIVGGLGAWLIGYLSLRTKGAYFIMITLAFGQMFFFFSVSWPAYGGEDGLSFFIRNQFPGLNPQVPLDFFIIVFAVLVAVILLTNRLNSSPFGLALNAVRQSPKRAETVGIGQKNIQLIAFVISGMITALAGALFADLNKFVSPTMFSWQISGELMILVILGGMGRLLGPLVGAVVFIILEEFLGGLSEYWHIYLGLLLLLVVLFAKGGIVGALVPKEARYVSK